MADFTNSVGKGQPVHAELYDDIIVQDIPAEFMRMGQAQKRGPGSPTAVLGRGDHSEVPVFFPKYFVSICF